jgi:hypothetical protein
MDDAQIAVYRLWQSGGVLFDNQACEQNERHPTYRAGSSAEHGNSSRPEI